MTAFNTGAALLNGQSVPTGATCVENYMTSQMNGDYGRAIDAAVNAQSLKQPSSLAICSPGDHTVSTPIVFDRPISFSTVGARLIPTSALGSIPVKLEQCALTAASPIITCQSTNGLSAGMSIGGIGIRSSAYITSVNGNSITISKPAGITYNAMTHDGSAVLTGLTSQRGLLAGQSMEGWGITDNTTIVSIDEAANSLTMSAPASRTSPVPMSFTLAAGSRWTSPIYAVHVTPVITWSWNPKALRNLEGQMIGGAMYGVSIADPGVRTITGVQGVQVYGWDSLKSYDLEIDQLAGAGLILGGNPKTQYFVWGSVRESDFINTSIRNGGDGLTGQPELEIMTPESENVENSDENNTLSFAGGHIGCWNADALNIGTFNTNHIGTNGPRLLHFTNGFQFEGCDEKFQKMAAPYDAVHIYQAGDVYFNDVEVAASGYGKSLFQVDYATHLEVSNSRIYNTNKSAAYTVSVDAGSNVVRLSSGSESNFDGRGYWDGQGITINDGTRCTPCYLQLASINAVSPDGELLLLASPYNGSSSAAATLTIGFSAFYFNITSQLSTFSASGNTYMDSSSVNWPFFGITTAAQTFYVGTGALQSPPGGSSSVDYQRAPTLGGLSLEAQLRQTPFISALQQQLSTAVQTDGTGSVSITGDIKGSQGQFSSRVTAPNIGGDYPTCNGVVVPCHLVVMGIANSTAWAPLYTPSAPELFNISVFLWASSPTSGLTKATAGANVEFNPGPGAISAAVTSIGPLSLSVAGSYETGSTLIYSDQSQPIRYRFVTNAGAAGTLNGAIVIEPK